METFATHDAALRVLKQIAAEIEAEYANDVWHSVANPRVADNLALHPYEDILLHTLWLPGAGYTFEDQWHWVVLEPSLDRLVQWGVELQQQIAALMAL